MREQNNNNAPKTKTFEQAHSTMEWLCSKMERCCQDAKRSLYRWGITSQEEQNKIIDKLKKDGFIDEQRYANCYVRDKLIGGRWGEAKIRAGLRVKGIEQQVIERAIEENIDHERLNNKLEQTLQRIYDKEVEKCEDRYKLKAKMFRRAASQGFDIETINRTIEKIFNQG